VTNIPGILRLPDLKESFRMKYLAFLFIIIISFMLLLAAVNRFLINSPKQLNKQDVAKVQISFIEAAIDTYLLNTGQCPNTLEDLLVCPDSVKGKWSGPYLKNSQLYDPWMYIYNLTSSGNSSYEIMTCGADGQYGDDGENADIYND
jgi:type II secretion system protein G